MHANATPPRKSVWHDRLARSGYLVGAILLHLIVFLMIATLVIWKAPPPPPSDEFHGVAVKIPPPPPAPPALSGDAAANPHMEPQPVTMPVVTPMKTISSFNNNFKVDTSKDLAQALNHMSQQTPQGGGLTRGGGNSGSGTGSTFGSDTNSGNQLTGYFYDFKQTSDKKPTGMDVRKYYDVLTEYLNSSWDDSLLASRYYRSRSPLYTDCLAISTRASADAPKAFHLENEVKPGLWAIHYHGKVTPAHGGHYRFIGFGDNVLVVKIDNTTVFDGGWSALLPQKSLHDTLPYAFRSFLGAASKEHDPHLKIGPSFRLDEGVAVDMDVLIGDDGGSCAFFLLIKDDEKTYETAPDGTPKAPFFQLGLGKPPEFKEQQERPPYSTTAEPWQSVGR